MKRRSVTLGAAVMAGQASLGLLSRPLFAQTLAASGSITLDSVTMPPEIIAHGQKLVLNGAGVRYRAIIRVYVLGLYVSEKTPRSDVVLRNESAKRLVMVLLRNTSAEELARTFARTMRDNAPTDGLSRILPDIIRLGQGFATVSELKKGDVIWIDYSPKEGVQFWVREKKVDTPFVDPLFVNLLFQIWLNPQKSVDRELTKALFGQPSTANNYLGS